MEMGYKRKDKEENCYNWTKNAKREDTKTKYSEGIMEGGGSKSKIMPGYYYYQP